MRTKVGDWVRICFPAWPERGESKGYLSANLYRVTKINPTGTAIRVLGFVGNECTVRSWVRCDDMREHQKTDTTK